MVCLFVGLFVRLFVGLFICWLVICLSGYLLVGYLFVGLFVGLFYATGTPRGVVTLVCVGTNKCFCNTTCYTGVTPVQTCSITKAFEYCITITMHQSNQTNQATHQTDNGRTDNDQTDNNNDQTDNVGTAVDSAVAWLQNERTTAADRMTLADRVAAMTFHIELLETHRETDRAKIADLQAALQKSTEDADRYKKLRDEANCGYIAQLRANDELQTQLDELRRARAKLREDVEAVRRENSVLRQHSAGQHPAGAVLECKRTVHKDSLTDDEVQQYAKSILSYSTVSSEIYEYCRTPAELVAFYFRNIGYGGKINETDEARILQAMSVRMQAH